MSKEKVTKKKFLEFETIKEGWNLYDLSDGTRLKVKFVLITVLQEPAQDGFTLGFTSKIVLGAIPPAKLMGEPAGPTLKNELRSSIVEDDIETKIVQEEWNIYKLENGIIMKIKNVLMNVSRTSKYDSKGIPIYIVDTNAVVKVPKKEIDRIMRKKKKTPPKKK